MVGFVESYNISVANALVLYHAFSDRMTRQGTQGDLNETQQQILKASMFLRHKWNHEQLLIEKLKHEGEEVDTRPKFG